MPFGRPTRLVRPHLRRIPVRLLGGRTFLASLVLAGACTLAVAPAVPAQAHAAERAAGADGDASGAWLTLGETRAGYLLSYWSDVGGYGPRRLGVSRVAVFVLSAPADTGGRRQVTLHEVDCASRRMRAHGFTVYGAGASTQSARLPSPSWTELPAGAVLLDGCPIWLRSAVWGQVDELLPAEPLDRWRLGTVSDQADTLWLDTETLQRSARQIRVWVKYRYAEPRTTGVGYVAAQISQWALDCAGGRVRQSHAAFYDPGGKVLPANLATGSLWQAIVPGSVAEGIGRAVCSGAALPQVTGTSFGPPPG